MLPTLPGRRRHNSGISAGNLAVPLDGGGGGEGCEPGWQLRCICKQPGLQISPMAPGTVFLLATHLLWSQWAITWSGSLSKWANPWLMRLIAVIRVMLFIKNKPIIVRSKSLYAEFCSIFRERAYMFPETGKWWLMKGLTEVFILFICRSLLTSYFTLYCRRCD